MHLDTDTLQQPTGVQAEHDMLGRKLQLHAECAGRQFGRHVPEHDANKTTLLRRHVRAVHIGHTLRSPDSELQDQ